MTVRTRIAPSPTGSVHIGTIHNALFAYALARSQNGKFVLRVEDTDQKRYVEGSVEELYKILEEFDLSPDEGPQNGGPYEPYVQSERVKSGIYLEAAKKLVQEGHAYYCFLSEDELKEIKADLATQKHRSGFRSKYRDLELEEAKSKIDKGESYVIRLKVPEHEKIQVEDAILGKLEWDSQDIDDQVIIKSDGFPTYHLAVVVDDHDMKISHVTRAFEWLPSTPKQVLLYRYLGYDLPIFAHSSLVLDPEGGKLSKRKGSVAAIDFLKDGYLVDAILNFLMLLGWSAPIERVHGQKEQEIFSKEEFIKIYDVKDRHKHNAVFNRDKLVWFNQHYIKTKDPKDLSRIFVHWLAEYAQVGENVKNMIINDDQEGSLSLKLSLVQERAKTLVEIVEMISFFYFRPENIDWDIKQVKGFSNHLDDIKKDLITLHEQMQEDPSKWDQGEWVQNMKGIADKYSLKTGDPFMVLRILIVGGPFSPPLFECLQMIGKKEVLSRLQL